MKTSSKTRPIPPLIFFQPTSTTLVPNVVIQLGFSHILSSSRYCKVLSKIGFGRIMNYIYGTRVAMNWWLNFLILPTRIVQREISTKTVVRKIPIAWYMPPMSLSGTTSNLLFRVGKSLLLLFMELDSCLPFNNGLMDVYNDSSCFIWFRFKFPSIMVYFILILPHLFQYGNGIIFNNDIIFGRIFINSTILFPAKFIPFFPVWTTPLTRHIS
jgi:hypothetical protein